MDKYRNNLNEILKFRTFGDGGQKRWFEVKPNEEVELIINPNISGLRILT